jgi:hypothetical protein
VPALDGEFWWDRFARRHTKSVVVVNRKAGDPSHVSVRISLGGGRIRNAFTHAVGNLFVADGPASLGPLCAGLLSG